MQAVLGYAVTGRAEEFVTPWRAIASDHVDFRGRLAQNTSEVVQQVENLRIVLVNIPGAVVAQIIVELCERVGM
jgi:hypothetical protein